MIAMQAGVSPMFRKTAEPLFFVRSLTSSSGGGGGAALFSHLIDNLGCRKSLQLVITRC